MTPSPKISSQQARRAITIDFEGNMESAPSLIGIHVDGTVRHFILEPQLGPLTSLTNRNYVVERSDLESVLADLDRMSRSEDRIISGFTEHEKVIVETYCENPVLVDWFSSVYVNAKKPIGSWANRRAHAGEIDKVTDRSLQTYMGLIGMKYKPGCGINIVGTSLTRLRTQLQQGREVGALSSGAKRRWWRILSHNTTDLTATHALLKAAVSPK